MTQYRGRSAVVIENDSIRVTALLVGGHVAEILHKETGVNPLWTPPWPSIEPDTYSLAAHPEYGADSESKLLAGIMGHNLCLDLFGVPTPEEASAGITVHGEGSVVPYSAEKTKDSLTMTATLPEAGLRFTRTIRLAPHGVVFHEAVENLSALDRPIAWTEHVTLGPPFVSSGATELRLPAARSHSWIVDREFVWPHAPMADGTTSDLRTYTSAASSSNFTVHLLDRAQEQAYFMALSPSSHVLFGYVWKRADFPWLCIWEENRERRQAPWNGETITCGLEFGVSPNAETRRAMIDRNRMFDEPCYRWIPAHSRLEVEYAAFITTANSIPESLQELQIDVPA